MTSNSREALEALVMRMQDDFLESATLKLTLPEAEQRFGVDRITCEAILAALVESHVLTLTPEATYGRFVPGVARAA
jgi:hypothetical protein